MMDGRGTWIDTMWNCPPASFVLHETFWALLDVPL